MDIKNIVTTLDEKNLIRTKKIYDTSIKSFDKCGNLKCELYPIKRCHLWLHDNDDRSIIWIKGYGNTDTKVDNLIFPKNKNDKNIKNCIYGLYKNYKDIINSSNDIYEP